MESPEETQSIAIPVGIVTSTVCEHEYMDTESDPNSNLKSALCSKCWNGVSYEPELYKITNGKLISRT